jgi:hypothetical protein
MPRKITPVLIRRETAPMRKLALATALAALSAAPAAAQPSGSMTLMAYSGIFQEN